MEDKIKEYVAKVCKPIFDKVLQEDSSNPMRVGRVQKNPQIQFLIQPHNHRLYYHFNKSTFHPPKSPIYKYPTNSQVRIKFTYEPKNYNSEHHFDNFYGCRIIVKKNIIEVINKWHSKQWRLITAENIKELDERVDEVINSLNNKSIEALKQFIGRFGGSSDYEVIRSRVELGIHGDSYLDKIPKEMIIQDTYFKKVYPDKVEFYDPVAVKNYIGNRAIESIATEIASAINSNNEVMNKFINEVMPILSDFSINIKTHTKVLKDISKGFDKFNKLLSERQKRLGDWI